MKKTQVSFFNYYALLNIAPEATHDEIKHAYRKMALKHHPDRADCYEPETFYRIKEAFETLTDDESRFEYDITFSLETGYERKAHHNLSFVSKFIKKERTFWTQAPRHRKVFFRRNRCNTCDGYGVTTNDDLIKHRCAACFGSGRRFD